MIKIADLCDLTEDIEENVPEDVKMMNLGFVYGICRSL